MSTYAMCNIYVFFSYRLCKCVLQNSFVLQKVRGKSSCISNLCISLYHCIVFWIMRIKIDICLCVSVFCFTLFCLFFTIEGWVYWQFYGLVYNKLEPQLFLLFDCHKYGELGSNEKCSGIESWKPLAVPSFNPKTWFPQFKMYFYTLYLGWNVPYYTVTNSISCVEL